MIARSYAVTYDMPRFAAQAVAAPAAASAAR